MSGEKEAQEGSEKKAAFSIRVFGSIVAIAT